MQLDHVLILKDLDQLITELNKTKSFSSVFVLVDENTEKYCLPIISSSETLFKVIRIRSGEENKNIQTCLSIWGELTRDNADRKSILINLGGGVIGDMGGFCAATFKRGISFIQIPTTLLSMVDASVGGKLGIDFNEFKNHIGVFQNPKKVLIFPKFLESLNARELRSGFAEIIKHCLIADFGKWEEIRGKDLTSLNLTALIDHSVKIKSYVVTEDPKEKGLRKILNFGHTIGHAVESFYLLNPGKKLLHGEAIAIGMVCEAWLSYLKGFISLKDCESIKKYLISIYGLVLIPSTEFDSILQLTSQDKKNEGQVLLFSLLEKLGKANFNIEVSLDEMKNALAYYSEQ